MPLVGHFRTFLDPVAQIQPRQLPLAGVFYLPQHGVDTERPLFFIRIEEGVNRRESIREGIGDGDAREFLVESYFIKDGVNMPRSEKVQILLRVGIVHAAARMTRGLAALVL